VGEKKTLNGRKPDLNGEEILTTMEIESEGKKKRSSNFWKRSCIYTPGIFGYLILS
jgi:hypothetical protein